jgi:tetraacyldisaccharide 4'-kinase
MRAPDFWKTRGPLALLLAPLGCLYGLSVARKARKAAPYKSSARVVCVGNLTAGGSGKTPVAMAVAEDLIGRGKKVFFLTRGYGGSETGPLLVNGQSADAVGDEALLLARIAATIVARDRAAGAKLAEAQGAEVIVMDDGHQNFSLAKDLSLVVVDGASGFGNGLMIPAGPLREPVAQGLARADAVIVMNRGEPDLGLFSGPVLRAHLATEGDAFRGKRVFAFAGIGRPEKFVETLQAQGAVVTGSQFFADHHPYTPAEIAALRRQAMDALLVTTEKDYVRLGPGMAAGIESLPVRARFDAAIVPLLDRVLAGV